MAKLTKEQFISALKEMTILEIKELVDGMKEEFGINPAAVAAASPATNAGAADSAPKEVNVMLISAGDSKINVIKAVKDITGLGLKEAKELVDAAPKAVKEKVKPEEAKEIMDKLTAAGATVEIK